MSERELFDWREAKALPLAVLDRLGALHALKAKRLEGQRKTAAANARIAEAFKNQVRRRAASYPTPAVTRTRTGSRSVAHALILTPTPHPRKQGPNSNPNPNPTTTNQDRLRENIRSMEKVGSNKLTDRYLKDLGAPPRRPGRGGGLLARSPARPLAR